MESQSKTHFKKTLQYGSSFGALFRRYKRGAIKRNLVFSLSENQFLQLIKSDCFYCGMSPTRQITYHNRGCKTQPPPLIYNGIARKNNKIGYILDNVVTCCWECNRAKGGMNFEQFCNWLKRVSFHLNSA